LNLVEGFRGRLRQALEEEPPRESSKPPEESSAAAAAAEAGEEGEEAASSGDEGWMSHNLKFRRDVTQERFTYDDYGA
jgi:hypothetical protein